MPNLTSWTTSSGVGTGIYLGTPTGISSSHQLLALIRSNSGIHVSPTGWIQISGEFRLWERSGSYSGGAIFYRAITGVETTGYTFSHSGGRFCGIMLGLNSTGLHGYATHTGINRLNYGYTPNISGGSGKLAIRVVGSQTELTSTNVSAFSGARPNNWSSGIFVGVRTTSVLNSSGIGTYYFGLGASGTVVPAKVYSWSATTLWG